MLEIKHWHLADARLTCASRHNASFEEAARTLDLQHLTRPTACVCWGRLTLLEGHGVDGDAHAGDTSDIVMAPDDSPRLPNLGQAHLIPAELFGELRAAGYDVHPGHLGENVTTAGLEFKRLPLGRC